MLSNKRDNSRCVILFMGMEYRISCHDNMMIMYNIIFLKYVILKSLYVKH
jgi:hypothetical protein